MADGLLARLLASLHGPVYRSRIAGLVQAILPHLRPGDTVLDIGCGGGALGRALMDAPECPEGVIVRGVETAPRGGEAIEVLAYDGRHLPFEDESVDVCILADVLHHDEQPDLVIAEAARVARRAVVIKDHKREGPLAQARISLMDWAANRAYDVPCLYRYLTLQGWRDAHRRLGLDMIAEHTSMQLYPRPYRWLFTPRLQYLAVLAPRERTKRPGEAPAAAPGTGPAAPTPARS